MHRRYEGVVVVCVLVALCSITPLFAQEGFCSFMSGYDPGHTGVSGDEIALPLVLSWRYTPEVDPTSKQVASAVVDDKMVYYPGHKKIYAVDRQTGELVWELSVGADVYSTPLLENGVLYFGAEDKKLWAVDAATGNRLWQFIAQGAVRTSPIYVSGAVYFGSDDGRVYALDVASAEHGLFWQFQTGSKVRTSPAFYRGSLFVVSDDGYLYAISASDGGMRWRAKLPSKYMFAQPVIERKSIIVTSGSRLVAYDTERGSHRWTFQSGGLISGAPAISNRRVYVGSNDGVVYCLGSNDGRIVWRFPNASVRQPITSPVSVSGDVVYARTGKTALVGLNAETGELIWEQKLPDPNVVETKTGTGSGGAAGGMFGPPGVGMDDPMMMGGDPGGPPGAGGPGGGPGGPGGPPGAGGPGGGGRTGRDGRSSDVVLYEQEDYVRAGISLGANSAYVVAADGVLYGFSSLAADNVAPEVSAALVDVPGRTANTTVRFPLVVDRGDTFAGRYADMTEVPGTPPITFSAMLVDDGAGVNPATIRVELDGTEVESTYDVHTGIVWCVYDPRGVAGQLGNGVQNIVITAQDWAGNVATAQASFTVDNSLEAPGPAVQTQQVGPGMMGPGMAPGMPEMPPMP